MYSPQRETTKGIAGAMKSSSKRILLLGLLLTVTLLLSGCRVLLPGMRSPQPPPPELTLVSAEPDGPSG